MSQTGKKKKAASEFQCAYTELRDVASLIPHPKNPNKHPEKQVKLLAKIIKYQGQRAPIVVSANSGFIVKGHCRLSALKELGWERAAIDVQHYDNEAQEFADLNADNKIAELAKYDDQFMIDGIKELNLEEGFDLELFGVPHLEIMEVDPAKDEIEDDVPSDVDTRCKPGDLWVLGEHRLLCGDSTDVLMVEKLMSGEKADMVFTDPPYGMGLDTDYSKITGSKNAKIQGGGRKYAPVIGDNEDFSPELINTIFASFDYCKEIFLWGADYYHHHLPDEGSWLVWDKRGSDDADKIIGASFELCWTRQKHKRDIARIKWMGAFGDKEARERVHPTQKPTKLIQWFFEKWGKDKTNIIDLFGGSGSTLIACEKTNRKCYMMELDPHYCDVILSRWEKYSSKEARLDASSEEH